MTNLLLVLAAFADVLVALLHVYVIVKGPVAYRRFGAGETIAAMAERGSPFPPLLTSGITLAFGIFAAYYFAAAGWMPALPYLLPGLAVIALLYVARAVMIVPVALTGRQLTAFELRSTAAALAIGLLHVAAALAYAEHACPAAPTDASALCRYLASAAQYSNAS
ncbi:hypothetical protein [Paraburkholderia dilworthii]|uniref:hypothetical protein n=1 Tax=Paraburkholderia dilworthii TaxID=948106 RepID=UPI000404B997|nr:hypothetical protein [Paraburkholderia dilworthii]